MGKTFISLIVCMIFLQIFSVENGMAQTKKPNIILILADDVGYKSLKTNGGTLYSTPYLDTLTQKGIKFTNCYASPLCSPSRFMLLTGKYNFRNYTKWGVMDKSEKTLGNLMKTAGYKTGFFGKEQLSGDGNDLNNWGFDAYCVTISNSRIYKSPFIYTHDAYLPNSVTQNKYGPDIIADSLFSFLDKNTSSPFFVYYALDLVHEPWCPTPNDGAAFTNWPVTTPPKSDSAYYPSMMNYMDEEVGMLMHKLQSLGEADNTVVLYMADNGTNKGVADYDNGDSTVFGGKATTTNEGTHVPLIAYWPDKIKVGNINNDIIDFTDFMPTLAGIAGTAIPSNFGTIDGVSFYPQLTGLTGTPRQWTFDYFDHHPGISELKRWAQTVTYKLYDTSVSSHARLFYNLSTDPNEKNPLPFNSLTPDEKKIREMLLNVINGYIAQGVPLLTDISVFSYVNDSTITVGDTIRINGGSTITASGAVWSTNPDPDINSAKFTVTKKTWGGFSTAISGLLPHKTYYVRAYATNFAGTAYSNQVFITTSMLPVATAATSINTNSFTANWNMFDGATGYRLDVSTAPNFLDKDSLPFFVPGYANAFIQKNFKTINGLKQGTTYYYRIRAEKGNSITRNSNVITASTNKTFTVNIFPNPSTNNFSIMLTTPDNESINIIVNDVNGNKVFQFVKTPAGDISFGNDFAPGVYFVHVRQGNNEKTLKAIKLSR